MPDFLSVQYVSPDGPREVFLRKNTYCVEEGFGSHASTYPVTIVPARYSGTYEGAHWLAFPVYPHVLAEEQWRNWMGSDIECAEWWDRMRNQGWLIGVASTPNAAYDNLLFITAMKAGFNLDEWSEDPTWNKNELKRRSGQDPAQ